MRLKILKEKVEQGIPGAGRGNVEGGVGWGGEGNGVGGIKGGRIDVQDDCDDEEPLWVDVEPLGLKNSDMWRGLPTFLFFPNMATYKNKHSVNNLLINNTNKL